MDGRRFDALTRAMAGGGSRRRFLKGLGAGVLGVAAGALGASGADAAACKRFGQHCNKSSKCCAGKCAPRRFVCECHHDERPCYTGTTGQKCCPRNERGFRRCCPNGSDTPPAVV